MQPAPAPEPPRGSEALLVVLDASPAPSAFSRLRATAFRLARTRLVYSVRDDLLGLFVCGAARTRNALAAENPGGYRFIDALVPPVANRLRAVRAVRDAEPSGAADASNLHDVLDVAGDALVQVAAMRACSRRLIVFTSGLRMVETLGPESLEELSEVCKLCREQEIQLNFVMDIEEGILAEIAQFDDACEKDDEREDDDPVPLEELRQRVVGYKLANFLFAARATGGVVMPLAEAEELADRPDPRSKRAMAKFRGVLDIAGVVQIPVKRFSHVAEANAHSATRLSWDASRRRRAPIRALVETQRVASARADAQLAPEEIVNAFPYGPDLVPEPAVREDMYAWDILKPCGLTVLGFVRKESVPHRLFLTKVDVLLPMRAVPEAKKLMRSLVLALKTEGMGILARSVVSKNGGAPTLCYLWPQVEYDEKSKAVLNTFLYAVDIPMREDIRDMPFDSLEEVIPDVSKEAHDAMDEFIDAAMLEGAETADDEDSEDEDDPASKPFAPMDYSNPNLDWFNICIVHRALQGIDGADLPNLSKWHEQILSPSEFVRKHNRDALEQATAKLKSSLPIMPVQSRSKRGRRMYEVVNGDLASLVHYLPAESDGEADAEDDEQQEEFGESPWAPASMPKDTQSDITDLEVEVGDETPVEDFESIIQKGKLGMAVASLEVVIRRLIREIVDDDKAMECLKALRRVSIKEKKHHHFNDFVSSLVRRCQREDAIGNRTAAFVRHIARRNEVDSALEVIPFPVLEEGIIEPYGDRKHREFLASISEDIRSICSKPNKEMSASNVTN